MGAENIIGLAIACVLLGYLGFSLFFPDRF